MTADFLERKPLGFWADDPRRDDVLRHGWGEHWTTARIAGVIGGGCTRNMVIGQARRLKLPRHHGHKAATSTRSQRQTRPQRAASVKARQCRGDVGLEPLALPPPDAADDAIPTAQRRQLAELERGHCRWPVGDPYGPDFFFCGGAAGIAVYCPYHARRAIKLHRERP